MAIRAAGPDALSLCMQHSARAEVPRHASNPISIYLEAELSISRLPIFPAFLCVVRSQGQH